jgi:hypothetical protein
MYISGPMTDPRGTPESTDLNLLRMEFSTKLQDLIRLSNLFRIVIILLT